MTDILTQTAHSGHDHGAFGELVEALFAKTPLPESWQEFFTHFTVDTLNIFALLILVMTLVYLLSGYINMDRLHHRLAHLKSLPGFFLAAAAGVLSPFCSCSIVPVLLGLLSVGVPVSVCLCYLTASSLLNLTAIFSLLAVAGPGFTAVYLICAAGVTAASTLLFSLSRPDGTLNPHGNDHHHHHEAAVCGHCFWHRLRCALLSALHLLKRCWLYILLGVLISSGITAFLSLETIARVVNDNSLISAAAVFLLGIPIHSDIFTVAPMLKLLISISQGVGMVFTLSAMAISIPSVSVLARSLRGRTVACYCGAVLLSALLAGYLSLLLL